MIRLTKRPEPPVLQQNATAWTTELLAAIGTGQGLTKARKSRYNNQQIKDALLAETHQKCAYCESKFSHVTYGDIEHIAPKDSRPELTYDWVNLTLACDVCNTNKGVAQGLVDPYVDALEQHFTFDSCMILPVPGNEKGRATVFVLKLNRTPLLERRKEKIDELELRLVEILKAQDANMRNLFAQALIDHARDEEQQYSACATAHIAKRKAQGHLPNDLN